MVSQLDSGSFKDERNPWWAMPKGIPDLDVFVRNEMPRTDAWSMIRSLHRTWEASANLSDAHTQHKAAPTKNRNCKDSQPLMMQRSQKTNTASGKGKLSFRSCSAKVRADMGPEYKSGKGSYSSLTHQRRALMQLNAEEPVLNSWSSECSLSW